jgi:hypothetical protein
MVPRVARPIKIESIKVAARGWGVGFKGDRVSVWEDEKVLDMNGGDCCLTI